MPSVTSGAYSNGSYCLEIFLGDAAVGFLAFVIVVSLALFLGGFSFIEPWLILVPLLAFVAGMVRGRSSGNIWIKSIALSIGVGLMAFFGGYYYFFLEAVLPSAGGIWLRRRRSRTRIA